MCPRKGTNPFRGARIQSLPVRGPNPCGPPPRLLIGSTILAATQRVGQESNLNFTLSSFSQLRYFSCRQAVLQVGKMLHVGKAVLAAKSEVEKGESQQ